MLVGHSWSRYPTIDDTFASPEFKWGTDPATSLVDPDCRSHDVDNLWICDGSVLPTVGAVDPSLTIQTLATRTARRFTGTR